MFSGGRERVHWDKWVNKRYLTLPVRYISESCIEIKIKLIFFFTLLCGASKGFMKAFKAFKKPFEVPQISVNFSLGPGLGREGFKRYLPCYLH